MNQQNFKIINDEGLPDIIDTQEPHDNISIFESFRACKNAALKLVRTKIEQTEKLSNKLRQREEEIHKLFKKNFEVSSDSNWRDFDGHSRV